MSSEKRKTRRYRLRSRAKSKAQTRRRIVEAAYELHATEGPTRTSFSKVAERAGVQRQTLYAHFPDEKSLFLACSAHHLDTDAPPTAERWRSSANAGQRLQAALGEIYAWYERNAGITAAILRDSEGNPVLREVIELRLGPYFDEWHQTLCERSDDDCSRALLDLALSFHSWRTLVRDGTQSSASAAEIMADAVSMARKRG